MDTAGPSGQGSGHLRGVVTVRTENTDIIIIIIIVIIRIIIIIIIIIPLWSGRCVPSTDTAFPHFFVPLLFL